MLTHGVIEFSTLYKRDKLAKIYGGASDQIETYRVDFEPCSPRVEQNREILLNRVLGKNLWHRVESRLKSLSIVDPIKAFTTVALSQKGKLNNCTSASSQNSSGTEIFNFCCNYTNRSHSPDLFFTNRLSYSQVGVSFIFYVVRTASCLEMHFLKAMK